MSHHYRWLVLPMGIMGGLLLRLGWQAVVLGLVYGILCTLYAFGYVMEQERAEAEKLRRFGGWPR